MLYIHYLLVFKEIERHNHYRLPIEKHVRYTQGRINHRTNQDYSSGRQILNDDTILSKFVVFFLNIIVCVEYFIFEFYIF